MPIVGGKIRNGLGGVIDGTAAVAVPWLERLLQSAQIFTARWEAVLLLGEGRISPTT